MKEPIISVCRASKRIAIFDGFKTVSDFINYEVESEAIEGSKIWIKERTDKEPKIVFPKITRMTMSYGRRKA